MAINAGLFCGGRHHVAVAECDSIRRPELEPVRSGPPPALTSVRYAKSYGEVKQVGDITSATRPPHLSDVATFYNIVLAVAVWNPVARELAMEQGSSLFENARTLALMNMAISDALVTVMETKYYYTRWRPETAIRDGGVDNNPRTQPDPAYKPFIVTPCFPSYPSAHASASYQRARSSHGSSATGGTQSRYRLPQCLTSCSTTTS